MKNNHEPQNPENVVEDENYSRSPCKPMERYRNGEEDRESLAIMEGNHWGFDGYNNNCLASDM